MTKIDCSKVFVDVSTFSTNESRFNGAFSKVDIKKGDLIEKGIVHRISNDKHTFDGMNNEFVFTWSDDIPNYTWAVGSGCSAFYNTNLESTANTRMIRYFDEDRFEIYAVTDIKAGEELTHTYKSLKWRDAFKPLYNKLLND